MVKKAILFALLLFVILFAVSCSPPDSGDHFDDDPNLEEVISDNTTERKIIITAEYEIVVKDISAVIKAFNEKVAAVGGYVQSSSTSEDNAEFTFRIPAGKLGEFLSFAENTGKVTYSSQKGEDVTIEYHDIQSELKSLKIQEERLLALLESAASLDNILAIEKQLGEVRTSIEKITTRLNELNNLVDYATVNVSIDDEGEDETFGVLLIKSFKASIRVGVSLAQFLMVALVFLFPYILLVVVIIIVARRFMKKKKKDFEKKNL